MKSQEAQKIYKETANQEEAEGDETMVGGDDIMIGGEVLGAKTMEIRSNLQLKWKSIPLRLQTLAEMYEIRTIAVLPHQDLLHLPKMKVLVETTTPL